MRCRRPTAYNWGGMASATDADLVDAIRQGDTAAEAELYDRFGNRVLYLALRQLGRREDGEDVRAEVFLRLLPALRAGKLREPRALPAFVLEMTRNVIRERLRVLTRTRPLDDDAVAQFTANDHHTDHLAVRVVAEVLDELLPRERAFLRMHFYEERSRDDISAALGIKEERVRLVKSRALKRFRERWRELTAR